MINRFLLSVALIPSLLAAPARAADADNDAGFVPLFNGKDLSGWVPVNVAPGSFSVKDGMIACTGVPTGVMRTEKMYENFIAELEWRHLTPGGNSGFFVWSDAITSKGVPFTRAIEVQVLDGPNGSENSYTTHGDVFPIHGATMTPGNPGKFAGRSYPTEHRSNPSPQWNHYRIVCDHGAISLAVNGKVVTTGKDASPRRGYICLESEGGQIEFRNLRIKELPADEKLDAKHVARGDDGYKSIYSGVDLAGWTVTPSARAAWQAKDWILRFEPPKAQAGDGGDLTLATVAEFADFDLIVDFRQQEVGGKVNLTVRGTSLKIDARPSTKKEPTWHHVNLHAKGDRLDVTLDGNVVLVGPALANAKAAPLGLGASVPTDFANLYLKPLP